jgi:DNA-binding Xre family transcriptional regulator
VLDVNRIIANNIQRELEKRNLKPVDLAKEIGICKQTMNKMMDGIRTINAIELHKIAEYLHVSMDCLMKMPDKPIDTNVIQSLMARVKTEAKKGIQLADQLSDMILFHTRVLENGKKMEQPWNS